MGPCTDAASRMLPFQRDTSVISDAEIGLCRLFLQRYRHLSEIAKANVVYDHDTQKHEIGAGRCAEMKN
jgi:hypothetical protein